MKGVKEAGREFDRDGEVAEGKLFKSGGSQAVRLPKAFRFEGDRVRIRRDGDRVILEPVRARPTPEETLAWLVEVNRLWGPEPFILPEDPPARIPEWALGLEHRATESDEE